MPTLPASWVEEQETPQPSPSQSSSSSPNLPASWIEEKEVPSTTLNVSTSKPELETKAAEVPYPTPPPQLEWTPLNQMSRAQRAYYEAKNVSPLAGEAELNEKKPLEQFKYGLETHKEADIYKNVYAALEDIVPDPTIRAAIATKTTAMLKTKQGKPMTGQEVPFVTTIEGEPVVKDGTHFYIGEDDQWGNMRGVHAMAIPAGYLGTQVGSNSAQRTDPETGITTTTTGRTTQKVMPGAGATSVPTAPQTSAPATTKLNTAIPTKSTVSANTTAPLTVAVTSKSSDPRGPVIVTAAQNPIDSDKSNLAAMGRDWAYLGVMPANPSLKVQVRQWMNKHDLQPGFPVPPAEQQRIRDSFVARNAAITLLDDIMANQSAFNSATSAGKIAVSLSPTATGALASRLIGLTDQQARVASDWQQLEEHINTVRLALGGGGFRGEEAWNALQRLRGNPLADPRIILQNVRQTRNTLAELNSADKMVMQGRGTDLSTPGNKIQVISPDGKPGSIPAEDWPAAEKAGYKKR